MVWLAVLIVMSLTCTVAAPGALDSAYIINSLNPIIRIVHPVHGSVLSNGQTSLEIAIDHNISSDGQAKWIVGVDGQICITVLWDNGIKSNKLFLADAIVGT
jgi:hypothetical protein